MLRKIQIHLFRQRRCVRHCCGSRRVPAHRCRRRSTCAAPSFSAAIASTPEPQPIVDHGLAGDFGGIEPFQTQRRGRMRAGAEGEAGIEAHDHRIGGVGRRLDRSTDKSTGAGRNASAGTDPSRRASSPDRRRRGTRCCSGASSGTRSVSACTSPARSASLVEQRLQHDVVPQRRFADAGFEDRVLVRRVGVGILQRDRQRAEIFERGFDALPAARRAGSGRVRARACAELRSASAVSSRRPRYALATACAV